VITQQPNFVIRRYNAAVDLPFLNKIEAECFPPQYRWSEDILGIVLADCDVWVSLHRVMAEDGVTVEERILGFIAAEESRARMYRGGVSVPVKNTHICSVDVTPAFRGQGIASAMMEEVEKFYREKGFVEAWLEVQVDNPAQILYFKRGYRVCKFKEHYYEDKTPCIVMKKTLWNTSVS
jgi:ribosomal protein S18 acetylase RimI-like enzyme